MKDAYEPLIYQYLKKYQQNPTSKVFAPLAEAYRKAGLVDEAEEIAREGLRVHPHFIGGRVALARALFDQKKYQEVIDELSSVVEDVPDNLVAQRLLAESSLMLGQLQRALSAYKMLLFFAPHDSEASKLVNELESQVYERGSLVLSQSAKSSGDRISSNPEEQMNIQDAKQALKGDPSVKAAERIKSIEILQDLLMRVGRSQI